MPKRIPPSNNGRDASFDASSFFAPDSPSRSMSGLVFWEWDFARREASYSDGWWELFGYGQDCPGPETDWLHLIFAEDREEFQNICQDCAEGRKDSLDSTLRAHRVDLSAFALLFKGRVVGGTGQGPPRLAGYAVDVTRLRIDRRFMPRLDDNAETYRAMLENSPDLFIRLNREMFPLYINPAISRYLSVSPEHLGASSYREIGVSEEENLFYRNRVTAVFETGCVIKETATLPAERGELTGDFCFWPEFGPDGKVNAVMTHMRDLTEQVNMNNELRLNEERFTALNQLTRMQDEPEEQIIRFAVEQIALLTRSKHSYLFFPGHVEGGKGAMHWSESMHKLVGSSLPQDRLPHECCTGRRHDFSRETPYPTVCNLEDDPDQHVVLGVLKIQRYVISPSLEKERIACIASVCNKQSDYTDSDVRQLQLFVNGLLLVLRRNRYMHDLKTAKESAETANRVKDEFLANVSHELRTPLNGMLSMLELLQLSPLSAEQLEYVKTAGSSGKTLLRILSDILDFSRMESGRMELQPAPFDLRAMLFSTMGLFIADARNKGIDLTISVDDGLPRVIVGDDARVRQIIINLMGNALKFTEKGGITLECSLLPHGARNKVWIYFVVRDTGIGIAPHAQSSIFEAFTQLDSSSTRKYSGTGLGLSIVKRLVKGMGGSLAVDSDVGEGTAIHCVLPFPRPDESARQTARQKARPPDAVGRRLDILVAEDDPASQFAIRTFLKRTGHRIVCVSNGRQALETLLLHSFDGLITDIQMPVMDGLETTRRIRSGDVDDILPGEATVKNVAAEIPEATLERRTSIPRNLPVVALTAHAMTGDREYFLRMGMDAYLSKPIIMVELNNILSFIAERER